MQVCARPPRCPTRLSQRRGLAVPGKGGVSLPEGENRWGHVEATLHGLFSKFSPSRMAVQGEAAWGETAEVPPPWQLVKTSAITPGRRCRPRDLLCLEYTVTRKGAMSSDVPWKRVETFLLLGNFPQSQP